MWPWAEPAAQPLAAAHGSGGLGWRLLRSRPTRLGWGLLLVCVLLWVMAVNYQINVAYVLVFWLLGVLLAGVVMTCYQLLGLHIRADTEEDYFAGQPLALILRADGRGRRRRWLWLQLGQHRPARAEDWQPWPVAAGGGSLRWLLPPQARGYLRVPPLRCVSMAPFGVLLAESLWQYHGEAVVYPAPIAHTLPETAQRGNNVSRQRRTRPSGDDLAYLQAHQLGASMQQVAWKQFAKSGELLDKRFEDQTSSVQPDWISYRDYPPHTPKEQLAGLLCHRVLQAEQQRHAYTLELPQQTIAPCAGQRRLCLTALGLW